MPTEAPSSPPPPKAAAPREFAAPSTAKGRMQRVAAKFVQIVDELTENQCAALEATGTLRLLNVVLGTVRAGQVAADMSVMDIVNVLQATVAKHRGG